MTSHRYISHGRLSALHLHWIPMRWSFAIRLSVYVWHVCLWGTLCARYVSMWCPCMCVYPPLKQGMGFFPCHPQCSLSYVYRERETSHPQPCSGPFWDFCLGPHPIRVHCELQGSCWADSCPWTEELSALGLSSIGLSLLCMAETSRSTPTSLQTSTILDHGWGLNIIFKHAAHWTCCSTQCIWQHTCPILGFPGGASAKEPTFQCRRRKRYRFDPWIEKIP